MRINEGWAEEQAIREAIMHYIFPVPEEEPEPEELLSLGPNRTRQKPPGTVVDEIEIQEYIRIEQEEKKMQMAAGPMLLLTKMAKWLIIKQDLKKIQLIIKWN